MTDFARRFAPTLGVFAFGVAGFVAMASGTEVLTALLRGLIAGFIFFIFGKLVAVALLYDPSGLPDSVPKDTFELSGQNNEEKEEEK
ncbi:hypothetical protein MNBD_NITROSPINAE04-1841 [hydrothermal vent metagenome]|uniref:Uncharacterized protein n=1 Tax=hydrothermal vent metagenome TaxID=652676 RepID=A0A3B1CKD6_9ZZZZ